MDIVAVIVGNVLVWVFGLALVLAVPMRAGQTAPGSLLPWAIGCAWFAGAFVLTLWMRLLAIADIPFGLISVGSPLLAVAAIGMWWSRRRLRDIGHGSPRACIAALGGGSLQGWQRALWMALLAWLALRYALLLGEVLMRPLFPWDAWTQWGTKAKVWFELRTMAPFLPLTPWLQSGSVSYIDAAPHYPATVPLLQVWSAILVGSWNDALVNLPWWLTGVAFAIAVYGFLVQRGLSALWALVATWLVASLPILNVHVALAGYADLPLSAFLTLGVLAGMQWFSTRQWRDAALALLLLAACVTIKNPGKVWLAVLVPGLIAAAVPRIGVKLALAGIGAAIVTLMLLAQTNASLLGYQLRLNFVSPWRGLSDAYFAFGNWHLLWYGAVAVAALGWRQVFTRELAPLTLVIASGLLFLFFGFAFTNAAQWVADQSTVNRATLHLAPLVAIWTVLVFARWAEERSTAEASPRPADSVAAA